MHEARRCDSWPEKLKKAKIQARALPQVVQYHLQGGQMLLCSKCTDALHLHSIQIYVYTLDKCHLYGSLLSNLCVPQQSSRWK